MIFERSITDDLVRWQARVDRKPLLVMGARQIGKTTAVRRFGERYFEDVAYFNLEKSPELYEFFTTTKDPVRIVEIQFFFSLWKETLIRYLLLFSIRSLKYSTNL